MGKLSQFESLARAQTNVREAQGATLGGSIHSPAQQLTEVYPFQSYFDTTLLETAILKQPPNNPIVVSTMKEAQVSGYAVGLHPSSQTPIAVEFKVGGQPSSSGAITLKPGQVVRPFGQPGGQAGAFSGIRYGLPFGWLGGGTATLLIFSTPDAKVSWTERTEVIFHRARYAIVAPAAVPATFLNNWPLRFPWSQAVSASAGGTVDQKGKGAIGLTPTRALITLRLTTLAAAATMRMLWQGSNDFGLDSAGAVIAAEAVYTEVPWPIYASAGVAGLSDFPTIEVTGPVARLAADDGGLAITGPVSLQGAFIDITRYGTL